MGYYLVGEDIHYKNVSLQTGRLRSWLEILRFSFGTKYVQKI